MRVNVWAIHDLRRFSATAGLLKVEGVATTLPIRRYVAQSKYDILVLVFIFFRLDLQNVAKEPGVEKRSQ